MFDCDCKRNSLLFFEHTTITTHWPSPFQITSSVYKVENGQKQFLYYKFVSSTWSTDCVLSPFWCILDCLLRADSAERSGCHLAVSHCWPIRCWGGEQLGRRLIYREGLESSHWVKSHPVLQIKQECIDSVRC